MEISSEFESYRLRFTISSKVLDMYLNFSLLLKFYGKSLKLISLYRFVIVLENAFV
jgi:hypothetical protein